MRNIGAIEIREGKTPWRIDKFDKNDKNKREKGLVELDLNEKRRMFNEESDKHKIIFIYFIHRMKRKEE